MQYRDFVEAQIKRLRAIADDRTREGASTAKLYTRIADELESEHYRFLTTELALPDAVAYSNFSLAACKKWRAQGKRTRATLPMRPRDRKPARVSAPPTAGESNASRRIRRKAS